MTESQTNQRRTTQAATQHKITEPLTATNGKIKPAQRLKNPPPKDVCASKNYTKTSEQLDTIVTTVVTTLLTAFIVSQIFIDTEFNQTLLKVSALFALMTLFLHFLSFITAHFAQINKLQKNHTTYNRLSWVTKKVNGTVYIMVVVMFVISGIIVVLK